MITITTTQNLRAGHRTNIHIDLTNMASTRITTTYKGKLTVN